MVPPKSVEVIEEAIIDSAMLQLPGLRRSFEAEIAILRNLEAMAYRLRCQRR